MKKMIIPTTIFIVILALVISMAIIIPSKNIYEIQSSRIRDNIITSVQVQEKQATYPETVETLNRSIYTEKTDETSGDMHYKFLLSDWVSPTLSVKNFTVLGTPVSEYYVEETIEYDLPGNTKISTTSNKYPDFYLDIMVTPILYSSVTTKIESKYTLQKNYVTTKAEFDALNVADQVHTYIDGTYSFLGVYMVYAIDTTLSTTDTMVIYFKSLYCYATTASTAYHSIPTADGEGATAGIFINYNSIKITPRYNYLSLENLTKTYGVDNKVISLSSNELMQNMTRRGTMPASQGLSIPILADYAVGVETAIIKCSVQQYYDTDSVLCVSPYDSGVKSIFEVGDIVIPYRFGATGDTPISKYPNGDAKEYKVVGVNIIDDGAIWQKLTLQEMRQILTENAVVFNSSASFYARFDYLRIYINSISVSIEETYQTPITIYPRIGDILQLTAVGNDGVFDGVVSKFQKDGVDLVDGVDGFTITGIGGRYGHLRFTYDLTKEGTYVAFIVAP